METRTGVRLLEGRDAEGLGGLGDRRGAEGARFEVGWGGGRRGERSGFEGGELAGEGGVVGRKAGERFEEGRLGDEKEAIDLGFELAGQGIGGLESPGGGGSGLGGAEETAEERMDGFVHRGSAEVASGRIRSGRRRAGGGVTAGEHFEVDEDLAEGELGALGGGPAEFAGEDEARAGDGGTDGAFEVIAVELEAADGIDAAEDEFDEAGGERSDLIDGEAGFDEGLMDEEDAGEHALVLGGLGDPLDIADGQRADDDGAVAGIRRSVAAEEGGGDGDGVGGGSAGEQIFGGEEFGHPTMGFRRRRLRP